MHFQALQVREIVILFVKDMHYILQQLFRFFRLSCQKIKHSPCYFFLKPKLKETDASEHLLIQHLCVPLPKRDVFLNNFIKW